MAYLDRYRSDGDYFTSLKEWETEVQDRYPGHRLEIEDHGHFQRKFVHVGNDPTGLDQVANFSHTVGVDSGHGFIQNA